MVTKRAGYRPDIDGLRAIAVLAVVLYHLRPSWLPGGFLGVDVFFVISGYLITSIIQIGIDNREFSVAGFYERRIRRIIPAFFFLLFVLTAVCCWRLLPAELLAYGKSVQYSILSLSNFHFLNSSLDYFNDGGATVPLLHTWSLGVEEQFYFIFPFFLIVLNKWVKSSRRRVLTLEVLFLVSYGACVWWARDDAMTAFFLLPFRAWEMLLGAILAVATFPAASLRFRRIGSFVGLVLIVVSLFFVAEGSALLWGATIIPCLGAGLLIYGGGAPVCVATKFLTLRPLVWVGKISYSVYLWHWPLIILSRDHVENTPFNLAVLGGLSLLAGWLSWRFVERPFRETGRFSHKAIFGFWLAGSLLFLGVSHAIKKIDGWERRFSEEVRHYLSYKKSAGGFKNRNKDHYDPARAAKYGDSAAPATIALWGDSHSDVLVPEFDRMARAAGKAFLHFGIAAQAPVPGVVPADQSNGARREKYTADTLNLILNSPDIHTIILHARWGFYVQGKNEHSMSPGASGKRSLHGRVFADQAELERYYTERITALVSALTAAGKQVVLIYPVPEAGFNVPDFLAKQVVEKKPIVSTVPCPDFYLRQRSVIATMDALPGTVIRIKPHERLLVNGALTVLVDNQPLYRDDDHLSGAGVSYLSDLFAPIFVDRSNASRVTSP